jgi:hypothetical protein
VLVLLVLTLFAMRATSAQAPEWKVGPRPLTVIGASGGGPEQELSGVTSAVRLPDGRVAVANNSPLEVRVYSASGALVSRAGRRGEGPGEFRGRITLHPHSGDSLLVFDTALDRWSVFSAAGEPARSWEATPEERQRLQPMALGRALIHPMPTGVNACVRRLIQSLALPADTAYLEILPDGLDRIWVRPEGAAAWRVYGLDGRWTGTVRLPAGFEMFQVGPGVVTGKVRDADDVESVVVFAVAMPAGETPRPACASQPDSFPRESGRERRTLQIDLRNLETATEATRSNLGHYASLDSIVAMSNFTHSRGVTLTGHALDGVGLDVVDRMEDQPGFCRLLMGDAIPAWLYRFPWCDPGSGP